MIRFWMSVLMAGVAALMIVGCAQTSFTVDELNEMSVHERALIMAQQPQVGDLYSADLSKFSEQFGNEAAFGLMRVVDVHLDYIIVITEDAAWPGHVEASVKELQGTLQDINWDEKEQIVIQMMDLQAYMNDGSIAVTRRLSPEAIRQLWADQ